MPAYAIRVVADTVVALGGIVHIDATVVSASGAVVSNAPLAYAVSDTTVIIHGLASLPLVGGAPGSARIVVSTEAYAAAPVTISVRVADDRPIVTLALGQTVTGQVVNGFSASRYAVTVAADEAIDFFVDPAAGLSNVSLRQVGGTIALTPTIGAFPHKLIYGGVTAPAAGTFLYDAVALDYPCSRGSCIKANGAFQLGVRRAGPIFSAFRNPQANNGSVPVPSGGSAVDTLWVQNLGAGRMTVSAASDAPFLTVVHPDAVVSGPTQPAVGVVPPGAVPIVVRFTASDAPGGSLTTNLRVRTDSSTWSIVGPELVWRYFATIYDPAIRIMAQQWFNDITVPATGPIFGIVDRKVFAVDRTTGTLSLRLFWPKTLQHIASAGDGTVYVAFNTQSSNDTIARLLPDGTLTPVVGWVSDAQPSNLSLAVLDDGTMYIVHAGTLYRRSIDGRVTLLRSGIAPEATAIAYHPGDDALYYVSTGQLRKLDLATLVETARGPLTNFRVRAVDGKGRIVGFETYSGDAVFIDTHATVVARIKPPTTAWAAAIRADTLFAGGPPSYSSNYLWKRPVP